MLFLSSCPSSTEPSGYPPHIWRGALVTPWNESFCPWGKNWDLSSQFLLTFQQQTEYLVVNLSSVSKNSQMFNLCFYSSSKVNRIQAAASCNYRGHRSRGCVGPKCPEAAQCPTVQNSGGRQKVGPLLRGDISSDEVIGTATPLLYLQSSHPALLSSCAKKSQTHPWTQINTESFLFFVFL